MNADSSVHALLEAQLAEAEGLLQRRSSGASLCSRDCAGVAITGLKEAEGRWAALREVQRTIDGGECPAASLAAVAHLWGQDLAHRRSQAGRFGLGLVPSGRSGRPREAGRRAHPWRRVSTSGLEWATWIWRSGRHRRKR